MGHVHGTNKGHVARTCKENTCWGMKGGGRKGGEDGGKERTHIHTERERESARARVRARERERERESIRPQEFRDRKGAGSTGPKSVTNTNKSQPKYKKYVY